MKTLTISAVLMFGVALSGMPAAAQTASLSVPVAVVKDADGKVMGQVAGFYNNWPLLIVDVEGTPALLVYRPFGLLDRVGAQSGPGTSVYFSDGGCTGTPYVNQVGDLELSIGTHFGVAGPDPVDGTYQLYRSTEPVSSVVQISSRWTGGVCVNQSPQNIGLFPAEPVVPNPLAGFHGPTATNPERTLTISGGDRIE